ncbi:DUF6308 family protein [Knoellia sp. S7-12]|uniref:DUF6308 family protein n=1 Tax=Knoellia sp. S7-12 TaxID=3126698 RepID=UPI00338D82B7
MYERCLRGRHFSDTIGCVPRRTDHDRVRQSIIETVKGPHAHDLVAAYFDQRRGFAGAMFDGLDPGGLLAHNPIDCFTVDDIAAASLLDVRFGPTAVREVLISQEIQSALRAVPAQISLWDASETDLGVATELWSLVRGIDGVGRTRASKLLARKRPRLIPIVDSVIAGALHLGDETWRPLAEALRDPELRQAIDVLRPLPVSKGIGTLRLLDVLTWMSNSRSEAAVSVQIAVGAPPTRSMPRGRTSSP